jgi:hypothetical protein
MRQTPTSENSALALRRSAGALFLLLSLTFLVGCQGLSAGASNQQTSSSKSTSNDLVFGASSVNFGSVAVGGSRTTTFKATNSGSASITISSATISSQNFLLTSPNLPVTLAAGQNTTIGVKFTPNAAGAFNGTIAITSDASNPVTDVSLTGTGMAVADGQLTPNSTSEAFGSVTVGAQQSQTMMLTNTGTSSVDISQATVSGTGFSVSGIATPLTLTAGQSTTFSVTFTPAAAGSASGTLTLTSNASDPTLAIPLSGTGVAAGALGASPTSLSFGSMTVGSNQSLSQTVTNTAGSSVTISQLAVSGSGFSVSGITTPLTLTAGQSTTFSVTFTPAAAGSASGSLTLTSNASNPTLAIPLSGTGIAAGALGASPTGLSFGSITVGSNHSLSETLTNTGGSSVTISQAAVSGGGFSVSGITTPLTLTAGQSTTFSVTFTPASAGSASGSLTLSSNASNPTLVIPLSGTGTAAAGQLTVTPTTLAIGSVVVGTSGTAPGSLTASGASVTVTAASSSNSVFSVSGLSLPVTIPAGQSATFTVTFSPQTTGAATASLTFTSNAQTSTTMATSTGTGTAAPTYSVNLSWTASTSPDISGYNIYRAVYTTACGSFSQINPTLNTSTLYTDSVVMDGTNYCYATTAVNSSNEESGYSNIVSDVQIPAP